MMLISNYDDDDGDDGNDDDGVFDTVIRIRMTDNRTLLRIQIKIIKLVSVGCVCSIPIDFVCSR